MGIDKMGSVNNPKTKIRATAGMFGAIAQWQSDRDRTATHSSAQATNPLNRWRVPIMSHTAISWH